MLFSRKMQDVLKNFSLFPFFSDVLSLPDKISVPLHKKQGGGHASAAGGSGGYFLLHRVRFAFVIHRRIRQGVSAVLSLAYEITPIEGAILQRKVQGEDPEGNTF